MNVSISCVINARNHETEIYTLHVSGVLIRPRWRKVVALLLLPVPEAAITVLCTPDDGCDGHPKHVVYICSK